MSLTIGSGPFGSEKAGVFNFEYRSPPHAIYFEDSPRRVRVVFEGETIAQSDRMKLLHETGITPVYYFPLDDVRNEFLKPSDHQSHCPFKGDARYWSVIVGDRVSEDAAWNYPEPLEGVPPLAGYAAFYFNRMDAWFEEDERIFVHARDPYTRIDVLASSRRVSVSIDGEMLAQTNRARLLFESGLPVRYYIPAADVATHRLGPSEKTTECPYKGTATYYSVVDGGEKGKNLVWLYEQPRREVEDITGYLCFFNDRVQLAVST